MPWTKEILYMYIQRPDEVWSITGFGRVFAKAQHGAYVPEKHKAP